MTYKEYIKWAKEYEDQARVVAEKIEKKRSQKSFSTVEERKKHRLSLEMLIEMERACRITAKLIRKKAEESVKDGSGDECSEN